MNLEAVERVARAVLYEGYMLYPYTASSLKNQQRWSFGVLYPRQIDTSEMQTEVLCVRPVQVEARVRFLDGDTESEHEVIARFDAGGRTTVPFPLGEVEVAAAQIRDTLFRITVRIRNLSAATKMLSTHTILVLHGGEFVSLMDPPPEYRADADACRNIGTWPVLAGSEGERDVMLSSPIILYDYPQIAPESPQDLFDSTEIDEILTLRVLTLSDDEKAEIRSGGARARRLLERCETLPPEQLMKLHGVVRTLKPLTASEFHVGDRVRLRPRRRADILDVALAGKAAVVEAVERDFENRVHLAVVLEDDPGRDLGMLRQPGHRFFFTPEEVEPIR